MAEQDVEVSTTIQANAERVWKAMTDPGMVSQWMMGAKVDAEWQQGGSIAWSGEFDGHPYTDTGEILEIEPNRRLVHTHRSSMSDDATGHVVSWALEPAGDHQTTLTLLQGGVTSSEQAEQLRSNWNTMLDSLRQCAEG